MSFLKKIYAKLFFKQYTIGILEEDIAKVIAHKKNKLSVTWFKLDNYRESLADPFIIDVSNGVVKIIAEIFTTGEHNGKICLITYSKESGFSTPQIILDKGIHLSYPCVYKEAGNIYVMVTEIAGFVLIYEFDQVANKLVNKKIMFNKPLVDATLLKYNGRYWLFGTLLTNEQSDNFHIFHADSLYGPYHAHASNPVKIDLNGCRSAGNFIEVDNKIYRPAQNCSIYYGESITLSRVLKLNEQEYEFDDHMTIKSNQDQDYNFGIHTINANGRYIVVDGQKGHFQPFLQTSRAIRRGFLEFSKKKAKFIYYFSICNLEDLALII